jgi:Uma2 family endonuclease
VTLEDEEACRGAEPDECYTVRRVVKSDEERPDIAIEVVWTSGGINKLEVYRKLGVREAWFYTRGKLRFFALRREPEDVYREIAHSELLPQLPVDVLLSCMQEVDQTSAVRTLRARLAPP